MTAGGRDLRGMFAAIDSQDASSFASYLADDAIFRFGSAPPVQGKDAIAAAVSGFFSTIAGCTHAIAKTVVDGDTLVCEGKVTYERHDGSTVTLPFADILEYDGELIANYKIYIDIGPLLDE